MRTLILIFGLFVCLSGLIAPAVGWSYYMSGVPAEQDQGYHNPDYNPPPGYEGPRGGVGDAFRGGIGADYREGIPSDGWN